MTLDIDACIDYLVGIERGLEIETPLTQRLVEAVHYNVDGSTASAPSPPFIAHSWTMPRISDGANGVREATFIVTLGIYARDANPDRAARIATQFWQKLMDLLPRHTTLGGNCAVSRVVASGRSQLNPRAGGQLYVGATIGLEVTIIDHPEYA